ncbi:glyoxalase/bleomycin resistance/extradiol dioxygenase family protein [Patulibacter sp.]|uniref:VOC family protein n=1 Tax=Patulibacter sp. TaxID=1912859 RepID=UPI002715B1E9|nr:VOC family protein [Patulibacter sp.]MDO9407319.1 VOC family protein [Patulibacter sp.]
MTQAIPTLRVRERSTLQHWVDAFGFELHAVFPADGTQVDHAQLRLGDGWIMAGSDREDGLGQPPGSGASYWVLDDAAAVEAIHERAVAAGAESLRPPNDPEYGGRECSLRDREGNLWSFGTYRPEDA